ncbi:uncharacterized [Tachysurus ichikawai]
MKLGKCVGLDMTAVSGSGVMFWASSRSASATDDAGAKATTWPSNQPLSPHVSMVNPQWSPDMLLTAQILQVFKDISQ